MLVKEQEVITIYYFVDFFILMLIYSLIFYPRWKRQSLQMLVIRSMMYIYIVMVIYVTIMPYIVPVLKIRTNMLFMESANFVPFRDLKANYFGAQKEII